MARERGVLAKSAATKKSVKAGNAKKPKPKTKTKTKTKAKAKPKAKASAKSKATPKKPANQPPRHEVARIAKMLASFAKVGLVKPSVNAERITKLVKKLGAFDDHLVTRVLWAGKCKRLATYPSALHYSVAGELDKALTGLPVRVRNVSASLTGACAVVFDAGETELENTWLSGESEQVVQKLDAYLAAHDSPRRVHRMPLGQDGVDTVLVGTPDEIAAVEAVRGTP